jgi:GT2 family glycosyltransferase
MKISINIICYQRVPELCNTLYSMTTHTDLKYIDIEYDINILIQNTKVSDYYCEILKKFDVRIFESHENLGVSGGRNFLIDRVTDCDLLFFFDDDLIFNDFKFQRALDEIRNYDLLNLQVYRSDGLLRRNEIPRPKCGVGQNQVQNIQECLYIIGAAHCIKRSTFDTIGKLSRELSGYGMEEIEFSLRAISKGFTIGNLDQHSAIQHMKSPLGRVPSAKNTSNLAERRLSITRTYLGGFLYFKVNFKWILHSFVTGRPVILPPKLSITVKSVERKTLKEKIKALGGWV